jgi:hypothetical protein
MTTKAWRESNPDKKSCRTLLGGRERDLLEDKNDKAATR